MGTFGTSMPNSTYGVILAADFDEQLFDECYADSGIDVTNFFNIVNLNTLNFDTTKAALAKDWTDKLANPDTTSFKIYNSNNVAMGYALGKVKSNTYLIYCILYKNNEVDNKDWVNEFWEENNCYSENMTPRVNWNYYSISFPYTSPLCSMLKQKHNIDDETMTLCVPRYASFETNYNEQQ